MPLVASPSRPGAVATALAGFSALPALGIACLRLCDWAMFGGGFVEYDVGMKFISRILQVVTMAVMLVLDRRIPYTEDTLRRAAGLAALGSAAGSILVTGGAEGLPALVGCALHGMCQAVALAAWGYLLCSMDPAHSAFGLTMGFALFGASTWVVSYLPGWALAATTVLALPASYLCLSVALCRPSGRRAVGEEEGRMTWKRVPPSAVAVLATCTVTSVVAHLLIPTTSIEFAQGYRMAWPALDVGVFCVYFVWLVVLGNPEPRRLQPFLLIVVVGGLIAYVAFASTRPDLAENTLAATQTCVMLLCWLIAADLSHSCRLPRLFTFLAVSLVFLEPITLAITTTGLVEDFALAPGNDLFAVATAACATLALVVAAVIVSRGAPPVAVSDTDKSVDEPPQGEESGFGHADPVARAVAELCREYGLTQREAEVATCLAHGYTLPQAAERLGVSVDTVRSRSKCLYRKLDIHKKQQLIELVEESGARP